jgi:ankyrin repeat protein
MSEWFELVNYFSVDINNKYDTIFLVSLVLAGAVCLMIYLPLIRKRKLLNAAREGNIAIVKALLDKGIDVNEKDREGKTALMLATENDHTEIVELLEQAQGEE